MNKQIQAVPIQVIKNDSAAQREEGVSGAISEQNEDSEPEDIYLDASEGVLI